MVGFPGSVRLVRTKRQLTALRSLQSGTKRTAREPLRFGGIVPFVSARSSAIGLTGYFLF